MTGVLLGDSTYLTVIIYTQLVFTHRKGKNILILLYSRWIWLKWRSLLKMDLFVLFEGPVLWETNTNGCTSFIGHRCVVTVGLLESNTLLHGSLGVLNRALSPCVDGHRTWFLPANRDLVLNMNSKSFYFSSTGNAGLSSHCFIFLFKQLFSCTDPHWSLSRQRFLHFTKSAAWKICVTPAIILSGTSRNTF